MRKLLAATVLCLCVMSAQADLFENGVAAYEKGDYAEAVKFYRLAAEQGHVEAQLNLGSLYRNGQGTRQDPTEALKWYRMAAEQGHVEAQLNLGLMYKNGEGTPQDYPEALKWYRLAAEQGHASAQLNLGSMYRNGQGVLQNYAEAYKWFDLAAGRSTDEEDRNRATENREIIAAKMTPAQVAEAQKLAREWDLAHPQ